MASTVEQIAGWASELDAASVPRRVSELCAAQRRSIAAAIAVSAGDGPGRRVAAGVQSWAAPGPAPLVGGDRDQRVRVEDALYAAAALSVAQDYDDYLCFAHSGHTSVLVPWVLGHETAADDDGRLVAQVAANEIAARLGGACLIGPLNGQMWSFVHAAAASIASGLLLGLGARELAHALAIALSAVPRPLVPGFMAPDTKLLTASEPALLGLRAARLAAAGVTGPLDVLDHPRGFLWAFAYAPLPRLLGNLGTGWATTTLCVKPYPGCAYIDTSIDALEALGPIEAEAVAGVDVQAGMLTTAMDALSRGFTDGMPTPVTVNFSVPWSVAVHLVAGRLSPAEVTAGWLAAHHHELRALAGRVRLQHDWAATTRSAEAFARVLPPAVFAGVGPRRLASGLRRVRRTHPTAPLGFGGMMAIADLLRAAPRSARYTSGRAWDPHELETFSMTFPARLKVTFADGRSVEAEAAVPRGGCGSDVLPPAAAAARKYADWVGDAAAGGDWDLA